MRIMFRRFIFFIIFFFISIASCTGENFPSRPQGYVSDFAGVLSDQQKMRIESFSAELEKKTTAQMAVLTISSVKPDTIEQYAVNLFEKWGIGKKGEDNGVLLLVAVSDRDLRIEVGYGLEGALTDATSKIIIERYIVPYFKQGLYGEGIDSGVSAIISVIAKFYGVEVTRRENEIHNVLEKSRSSGMTLGNLLFFAILLILFILNPRLFLYMILFSAMGGGRRGYWSGGGGGYGGGFGGFGGGMSGGGGASGRW